MVVVEYNPSEAFIRNAALENVASQPSPWKILRNLALEISS